MTSGLPCAQYVPLPISPFAEPKEPLILRTFTFAPISWPVYLSIMLVQIKEERQSTSPWTCVHVRSGITNRTL